MNKKRKEKMESNSRISKSTRCQNYRENFKSIHHPLPTGDQTVENHLNCIIKCIIKQKIEETLLLIGFEPSFNFLSEFENIEALDIEAELDRHLNKTIIKVNFL